MFGSPDGFYVFDDVLFGVAVAKAPNEMILRDAQAVALLYDQK